MVLYKVLLCAKPNVHAVHCINPIWTGEGRGANWPPPPGIDHMLYFEKCRYELQTS